MPTRREVLKGHFQSLFISDWGWIFNRTVCQQAPNYLDPPPVKEKGTLKPKAKFFSLTLIWKQHWERKVHVACSESPSLSCSESPKPRSSAYNLANNKKNLDLGLIPIFPVESWGQGKHTGREHKQVYIQRVEKEIKSVPSKQITSTLFFFSLMQDKLP